MNRTELASRAWIVVTAGVGAIAVLLLGLNSSVLLARDSTERTQATESLSAASFLPIVSRPLPLEEWPECAPTRHDPKQWHDLINAPAQCHYNHEHKDNPHLLDDVFGTQVYDWAGGSISYPWQTGDGHGENEHKHEVYGWIVVRDLPPDLSNSKDGSPAGTDTGFIKHLRIQGHFDLNAMGAPTRFHSSYIEVMVCYKGRPNDCGIVRFGGHQDYGELRVDGNWIPLPGDPDTYDGVEPPAVPEREYDQTLDRRAHSSSGNGVQWRGRFHFRDGEPVPISYAGFNHGTIDAFGPLNPQDISQLIFTDPEVYNNSTHGLDFFILRMREWMADEDGRINWSGYANRYGLDANPSCTEVGLDCVPISFENVPAMRGIHIQPRLIKEFDTSPPGASWIEYPN